MDFTNPTRHERQRSRRHRPGRAGDHLGRRPLRQGRVRAQDVAATTRACWRSTSSCKAQGKPPVDIQEASGEPRRRRPARDGQCRADSRPSSSTTTSPSSGRRSSPNLTVHDDVDAAHGRRRWRWRSARTARSWRPSSNAFIGEVRPRHRRSAT